ncbi:MAG: hypothetical protein A2Y15_04115 [Clostridiales bacterium GWF2_36_10]|nr:MAG: hypothetical protein A2Y15_04115 [Clostridiales bacterium GWF2_36_10]HAN20816.1 hypothetical protein [Clostridiales bacterium]
MFGYIRPVQSELLVREYDLYRAVYCGLCRYGGKHLSHFTRFFLNYDFVTLALLRLSLSDERAHIGLERCPYHIKKRRTLCANGSYEFTCSAFAILLYYKVLDDINDSKGFKKLIKRMTKPFFKHLKKNAVGYAELEKYIKGQLDKLSLLEKDNKTNKDLSIDKVANCFAAITEYIASYGLEGEKKLIAAQCGYHIGRYIYIIDALDDLFEDNEKGNYNPLLNKYGSISEVMRQIEEIKTTITDSMNAFSSVYGLITIGENPDRVNDYDNIIFNICELGGKAALNKVLLKQQKNQEA